MTGTFSAAARQDGAAAEPLQLRVVAGPRDTPLVASLELELVESGELQVQLDDGERGWSLAEQRELRADGRESIAAPAGREVEFEVRIAHGGSRDRLNGVGSQRRSAQIGVEEDPRGVDDPARMAATQCGSQLGGPLGQASRNLAFVPFEL